MGSWFYLLVFFLLHTFPTCSFLLSPFCLICICGSLALALAFAASSLSIVYSSTSLLLMYVFRIRSCCCCMRSSPFPPTRTKVSKKKPATSLFCTHNHPYAFCCFLAVGVLQLVGQPVQALVQSVAAGCAGRLNVPVAVPQ